MNEKITKRSQARLTRQVARPSHLQSPMGSPISTTGVDPPPPKPPDLSTLPASPPPPPPEPPDPPNSPSSLRFNLAVVSLILWMGFMVARIASVCSLSDKMAFRRPNPALCLLLLVASSHLDRSFTTSCGLTTFWPEISQLRAWHLDFVKEGFRCVKISAYGGEKFDTRWSNLIMSPIQEKLELQRPWICSFVIKYVVLLPGVVRLENGGVKKIFLLGRTGGLMGQKWAYELCHLKGGLIILMGLKLDGVIGINRCFADVVFRYAFRFRTRIVTPILLATFSMFPNSRLVTNCDADLTGHFFVVPGSVLKTPWNLLRVRIMAILFVVDSIILEFQVLKTLTEWLEVKVSSKLFTNVMYKTSDFFRIDPIRILQDFRDLRDLKICDISILVICFVCFTKILVDYFSTVTFVTFDKLCTINV